MKKFWIVVSAALLMQATPAFAGTMDDIGDTMGDIADSVGDAIGDVTGGDIQFGAGIGMADVDGLKSSFLLYGIAESELDLGRSDIMSSAQVRIGTGTSADVDAAGVTGSGGVDYFISGLYKGSLELSEITAYGIAGITYASASGSVTFGGTTTSTTTTDTKFTWGLGAEYEVERDLKVAAEYITYSSDLSAFAANVYFSF